MVRYGLFDLEAFCAAIELRDAPAQLHFYAPHAEVTFTYAQNPTQAARVLSGRAEIYQWIRRRCAENDDVYQVVYHWIEADQILVTEECRRPDGTSALTASTGIITDGRIISQSVVRIHNT